MTPRPPDPLQTWTNLRLGGGRAIGRCVPGRVHSLGHRPVAVLVFGLIDVWHGAGPGLRVARHGYHAVPRGEVHQPDSHRLPPGLLHLGGRGPDDAAGRGDRVDLVLGAHHERPDKLAALVDDPGGHHAHRAAPLDRVLADGGALGVTA